MRVLARRTDYRHCVCCKKWKKIVGAVRLCKEEGVYVLRGMEIAKTHQRQGIGSLLLEQVARSLRDIDCYGICYPHLETFYGKIGFTFISQKSAPRHLQKRVREYRKKNKKGKYKIMFRDGDLRQV